MTWTDVVDFIRQAFDLTDVAIIAAVVFLRTLWARRQDIAFTLGLFVGHFSKRLRTFIARSLGKGR